jgi:hypothetical protein
VAAKEKTTDEDQEPHDKYLQIGLRLLENARPEFTNEDIRAMHFSSQRKLETRVGDRVLIDAL